MVDESLNGDNHLPTYGEFVRDRILDLWGGITVPLIDEDDGELIEWPATLLAGDVERVGVLESPSWQSWAPQVADLASNMVLEALILLLHTLPGIGINPQDDLFELMADVCGTFYARGYVIGLVQGAEGPAKENEMLGYMEEVVEQIDDNIVIIMEQMEDDDFEWPEGPEGSE